jgi:hypothetical protein
MIIASAIANRRGYDKIFIRLPFRARDNSNLEDRIWTTGLLPSSLLIVDYLRLMGEDQTRMLAALRDLRETLFDPFVTEHRGAIVTGLRKAGLTG